MVVLVNSRLVLFLLVLLVLRWCCNYCGFSWWVCVVVSVV